MKIKFRLYLQKRTQVEILSLIACDKDVGSRSYRKYILFLYFITEVVQLIYYTDK